MCITLPFSALPCHTLLRMVLSARHHMGELGGLHPFQVPRVDFTLPPRLLARLRQLPVVEARTEAAGDRLWILRAPVVTKAVVRQSQRLGQQPALAIIAAKE